MSKNRKNIKKEVKYFFCGFFSDRLIAESDQRNYLDSILAIALSVIFVYCGIILGFVVPVKSHYCNASDFRDFVYQAFAENGVILTVSEGKVNCLSRINTYDSAEDKEAFYHNGYELVVDTRASDTTFDDFEAYCVSKKDETRISYEQYLTLSAESKSGYEFKIKYTGKELIFTDEKIDGYEEFLASVTDEQVSSSYTDLKAQNISKEKYAVQLYCLYVKSYYPEMSAYEVKSSAPLLRNYYYNEYINAESNAEKYLFVFDDFCVASFITDRGVKIVYSGYYTDLADKTLNGKEDIDIFLLDSFRAASQIGILAATSGFTAVLLSMMLIWLLCLGLTYFIGRFVGLENLSAFSSCVKASANFTLWSGFITFVSALVASTFVARDNLLILSPAVFFLVLFIRTVTLLICEYVRKVKADVNSQEKILENYGE